MDPDWDPPYLKKPRSVVEQGAWRISGAAIGFGVGLLTFLVVKHTFTPVVLACSLAGALAAGLLIHDWDSTLTRERLFIQFGLLQFILMTGFLYRKDVFLRMTETPGIGFIHLIGLVLVVLTSWVTSGIYPSATKEGRLTELLGRTVALVSAVIGTVVTSFWGVFWGTGS